MRLFLAGFLFLLANTALAQSAESLLARDLLASAKTLQHEIRIYNYFNMEKIWPGLETEAARKTYAARYLSARAGLFWNDAFSDSSPKTYAAGPALYFAIDPLISAIYGNTFIEMAVPAGTRFMNVVTAIPVKRDTLQALQSEHILNAQQESDLGISRAGFYRDTLRLLVEPQYRAFRALVRRVFAANNIQFVEYNFNTSLMGFCSRHSYSAFAFVGALNPSDQNNARLDRTFLNLSFYSTELQIPNPGPDETAIFNRVVKFRSFLDEIADLLRVKKPVTRDFLLSHYNDREMQDLKDESYSCE